MNQLVTRRTARMAANVATIAFGVGIVLQLLLAAGILPVTMAWGGSQPVLTTALRLSSLLAVVILGLAAYVIRRRAGLIGTGPVSLPIKVLAWVITAYMALNALGNFASASAAEKLVFGPIALILFGACLLVSISRTDQ